MPSSISPSRRRATREASLVKALEEHGIGRPSTYATIISTLQDREYVEMDSRRFVPTDIGKIVNRFLTHHFHRYVEYGFTAAMEDELDADLARRGGVDAAARQVLEALHPPGGAHREERLARASRAGARARQGRRDRQAGQRAHGTLRPLRADRHQGRCREAALRRLAARAEDGRHHARRCDGALQAAARARPDRRRRGRSSPTSGASART